MVTEVIKFLAYGITMCIVYAVVDKLHNKKETLINNESSYIVKFPNVLKKVYGTMFGFGIFLFLFFGFFYIKGNPTITKGHLIFALVFAFIGLLVSILSSKWRIVVNGNQMEIHRLLRTVKYVYFNEITMTVGNKSQIIIYKNGKKIVTVDALSDNYDNLKTDIMMKNADNI